MNLGKESETVEFKVSASELEDALVDIVAILNKHSEGKLYFGVKNSGDVCGFQIGSSTERDISRRIFESIRPQIVPTIQTKRIDDKFFIEIDFSGYAKPYSTDGRYYIRSSDESREMPPAELARFILNQNYSSWEATSSDCTLDNVDETALESFFAKAVNCQRMKEMTYDKKILLSKLNLLGDDQFHLNNAGKLLFSNTKPIKLKMGVFATNEKSTFVDIHVTQGNIFSLMEEAENYVEKNIHYSVSINGFDRTDVPEIPLEALREIITNSFAHANYLSNSQHEIDIFPNRIAIYNPGAFPDNYSPEDFVNGNLASKVVNELICAVLFKCKAIESWGTGLKNTYRICREANVAISYEKEQEGFWFIFHRNINSGNSISDTPSLEEGAGRKPLREVESLLIEEIRKDPKIDRAGLSKATGRSSRTIQRILDSLKKNGYIRRVGSPRKGYWEIIG